MKIIYAFFVIIRFSNVVYALFEQCDHQLILQAGGSIYVNSPNFPNRYPSLSSCRYTITAPAGYQIDVKCNIEIDTVQQQCATEVLYFNLQGSNTIPGSDYHCGTGQIHKISFFNRIVFSYISSSANTAGRFMCLAIAIPSSNGNGSTCECGWSISRRIVGGSEAGINEFPSVAGVYDKSQLRIFCGASIIHTRYLLSAAHCFAPRSSNANLAVMIGDHDFTITTDTPYTRTHDIERVIIHENFISNSKRNDIALLATKTPMEWTIGVGPACLPFNYNSPTSAGPKVDTAGWGTRSFGGNQPHELQKVTLDVVLNSECSQRIPSLRPGQLCTYTLGKDTCQYDSGGGLFFRNSRMYLVGIVSFGYGCAMSLPSVSTRVSSYLNWIQQKTNVEFCRKYDNVIV